MLGVATMIVVNSVMEGFTHEMQDRIHGILSDVVVESHSLDGFPDADWHMEQIREVAGDDIEGMTPTVVVPAMLSFRGAAATGITRQVQLDRHRRETHARSAISASYLQHPENREQLSFELREGGYDTHDHQAGAEAPQRDADGAAPAGSIAAIMAAASQGHAKRTAQMPQPAIEPKPPPSRSTRRPIAARADRRRAAAERPSDRESVRRRGTPSSEFDPAKETAHRRRAGHRAGQLSRRTTAATGSCVLPGDDVKLTVPTAGTPPKAVSDNFTVVDFYESKMSEYDSSFVFVPIRKLQEMRGMIDPATGVGNVTSIQIKLHSRAPTASRCATSCGRPFRRELYGVQTWRDKQGPLLAAVQMETAILNVLLFLIIAVAGFGILAIFYMIVVEKTRDIGILKSLGAPSRGVMGIFLGYGLSLGIVGAGVGMVIGLLFVAYINEIADVLGWLTGQEVFDPAIYYFQQIPTIVEPLTVSLDRGRRDGDRGAGQHSAGPPRRAAASRGGPAL